MFRSIRTRLFLSIGLLFALLLAVSIVSVAFINRLSRETENILKNNSVTIRYCNDMLAALDDGIGKPQSVQKFERSLQQQEANITEHGESVATAMLRQSFEVLKRNPLDSMAHAVANNALYKISDINQKAIERKNKQAIKFSQQAKLWISVCAAVFVLLGISLAYNIPQSISEPIQLLTEGIREIANKNYRHRIRLDRQDEFGQMAEAFNSTTEKLYEYENSNLARLMFEKQRVDTVINQMDDAVMGLDADNRILFLNRSAESLLYLNAFEVTGKHASDVALHNDLLRTILKGETQQPLKIVVDGKENFFTVHPKEVFLDATPLGRTYTLRNITAFKELDLSKTNLLATISHELKTPISGIKMSAQLLQDSRIGALNGEQQEMVHNIADDTERLLRLTSELLNLTQLESGKIQLKLQPVAVSQLIQAAIKATQLQAQHYQVAVVIETFSDDAKAIADSDKASWVLINLLNNAIRYSPSGQKVNVHVATSGKWTVLQVKDSGPGIEPQYLSKLFDRYYQIPGTAGGSGLGLSISKEFMEAQDGRLTVESVLGQGASFKMWFKTA